MGTFSFGTESTSKGCNCSQRLPSIKLIMMRVDYRLASAAITAAARPKLQYCSIQHFPSNSTCINPSYCLISQASYLPTIFTLLPSSVDESHLSSQSLSIIINNKWEEKCKEKNQNKILSTENYNSLVLLYYIIKNKRE